LWHGHCRIARLFAITFWLTCILVIYTFSEHIDESYIYARHYHWDSWLAAIIIDIIDLRHFEPLAIHYSRHWLLMPLIFIIAIFFHYFIIIHYWLIIYWLPLLLPLYIIALFSLFSLILRHTDIIIFQIIAFIHYFRLATGCISHYAIDWATPLRHWLYYYFTPLFYWYYHLITASHYWLRHYYAHFIDIIIYVFAIDADCYATLLQPALMHIIAITPAFSRQTLSF